MSTPSDEDLLARIEDAGINASAPREQVWLDGWLVRTSPGKAKRARCIQPVADGREPVDLRLARCRALYAQAGVPLLVRITPFARPAGLDDTLAALGLQRIDDTRVMWAAADAVAAPPAIGGLALEAIDLRRYADWIGPLRDRHPSEHAARAERLRQAPVPHHAWIVRREADGAILAGGLLAVEGDLGGYYEVLTVEAVRRCGVGELVCRHLAGVARELGVRTLYLQVDAANGPARALYAKLGFRDGYGYHYRAEASASPPLSS